MKKVANCFMSLGSISRARAIFNGVMSKNRCRVVLIALLMFVCGSGSMFAQCADGDIITISIQITGGRPQTTTTHYLSANNVLDVTSEPIEYSLWKVSKVDGNANQFTFTNVGDPSKELVGNGSGALSVGNKGSAFTLEGNRLKYANNQYINYESGWKLNNKKNSLTFTKWTHVKIAGGIQFTVNPTSVSFTEFTDGTVENPVPSSQNVTVTMTPGESEEYYENPDGDIIEIDAATGSTDLPNISNVSAAWESNNNNNASSSAKCQVYGSDEVSDRQLMQITSCTPTDDDKRGCTVTVAAIGNSPMEMKTEDGKWKDHSDVLIVTFRDTDKDATYRARVNVTRYSFHAEELPNFIITTDPSSVNFKKTDTQKDLKISVKHQHGTLIRHMYGNISSNASDYTKEIGVTTEDLSDLSFATFSAKKITDETNSDWLTVGEIAADGTLPLATDTNTTGIKRIARLVGLFNYTNPSDPSDKHFESIELQVTQNAKDGNWKLIPNKGHSGDSFGKNPHTQSDQQQVHTVEKIIYYTPGQADIELRLAEMNFRGYMRWYDYKTEGDPIAGTSWKTAPQYRDITGVSGGGWQNTLQYSAVKGFTEINSGSDSYGVYALNDEKYEHTFEAYNTPVIKGWSDNQVHIIACDVSSHKDYDVDDENMTVTEPTLSYRQLFYLHPATEIAKEFKAAASRTEGSKFLENYEYTAPSGRTVMLSTQFRYKTFEKPRTSHPSELCYYYYKNGVSGELGQVGVTATAEWRRVQGTEGTTSYPTFDYYQIPGETAGKTAIYELVVPNAINGNTELKIARFVVKFVDLNTHGPVNSIMTQGQIADKYQILEFNDFSYGVAATGTSAGDQNSCVHSNKHLPWGEATYGFYYPTGDCDRQNSGQGNIPYYGEYALLSYMKGGSWGLGEQHGGARNGYALYVDGTTEPGLVASISTDAVICEGQTLYCSLWLMNPRTSADGSAAPIFRCNIQGRNAGGEWQDVGLYYVGALTVGDQNWKQVVFPINSGNSYDETRVQIYNFGTGGNGNDFLLDDLCLYVSPLPLAAYQASMGCRSHTDNSTTSTAVVVRIDYSQLNDDLQNAPAYYQIYNESDGKIVNLKTLNNNGEIVSAYYAESGTPSPEYGSITIPAKTYEPTTDKRDNIQTSLQDYIEDLIASNIRNGKCYVRDNVNNKWFLYVLHIVPNTQSNVYGEDEDIYLVKDKNYILRIASAPNELTVAECASTTELHATTDTYLELRDDRDGVVRVECEKGLCANNHYFLDVKVQNTLATSVGGTLETIEALVHADWLVGVEADDAYCNPRSMTNEEKEESNNAFEDEYGCTRNALRQAISNMRMVDLGEDASHNIIPNPNYTISDPNKLEITTFFSDAERALIQRLCAEGKLKLYQTTSMFYMGSDAVVRYWVYPVAKDAKVTFNGQEYPLYDCDEPLWVRLQSDHSEYAVNLSPIEIASQKPHERLMLPSIRLVEGTKQVVIPVNELTEKTNLYFTLSSTRENIVFDFDKPIESVLEYVDLSNNRIDIVSAPSELEPGKDYLMRMAFYDEEGNVYIGGDPKNCRVGYIYFYLSIVPKVVQWTGEASSIWGDDKNWKGVKEDGSLMDVGFAPLPETNVIIKALGVDKPYPIVTTDDHYPMDVNHIPNACDKIYFETGTTIYNQHLLQYNKAFVDMKVPATAWNTMAAPMQGMYTGDMFIPHKNTGTYQGESTESTDPFVVNPFNAEGSRLSTSAFAFWQSFYNKRVTIYHENGNTSSAMSSNTAAFAQTNSLSQKLEPGTGFQVLAYGPTNKKDETLIVRLPKPDTEYTYFNTDGSESWQKVSVEHSSKLAFTPSEGGEMVINLANATASNQFMFGNPTMTKIDMAKFIADNPAIKSYSTMVDGTWNAENEFTMVESPGLLAPMRSVLLNLQEGMAKTSLQVVLKTSHLVGYTDYNTPAEEPETVAPRKNSAEAGDETMLMTVYATSNKGQARCMVVANGGAKDTYDSNEDVLFFSSGVEEGVNSATATSPVNMYTVSEQVPMMVDVREKIDTVPLSMLVQDKSRTEKVKFAFYLSLNWDKECYFCDAVTGERYRILDGLVLEMDMPQNHEVRYFIDGPDVIDPDNGGDIWSSTEDVKTSTNQVWAYSPSQGQLVVASNDIIKAVMVYDIAGRLIGYRELEMQYNSTTFDTPTGACIVKAVLRDNTEHYISALVK